jgi:hypothetical protein
LKRALTLNYLSLSLSLSLSPPLPLLIKWDVGNCFCSVILVWFHILIIIIEIVGLRFNFISIT